MKDLELKRQRIEAVVKIVAMLVTGFLVAPFIFVAIQGLIGLVIAAVIGATIINFAPWMAMKFANWRLKALKAEAAANPIETLENQYREREKGLTDFRDNILQFHAEVQNFWTALEEQSQNHPELKNKFMEQYNKMRNLLEIRSQKYKLAQKKLKDFSDLIDQKRSEWELAQAAARMTKAAGVGEEFMNKLMMDTAVNSVQTSLNTAFAELEVSLLDEQPVSNNQQSVSKPTLVEKNGPPPLDLDIDEKNMPPRQKIAVA